MSRSFISLAIFLHLVCVAAVVFGNLTASRAQTRFITLVRPYCRTLNLEFHPVPYHLTHATEDDVDLRIDVLPTGKDAMNEDDWIQINQGAIRGTTGYTRYRQLGREALYMSEREDMMGMLAKNIAINYLKNHNTQLQKVRVRAHTLQEPDAVGGLGPERDPNFESYFTAIYTANILTSANGEVLVSKDVEASRVAAPDTGK